ncbi:MAG: hypothetical protein H3C62_01315 [Gemmatimonadaceae bacterium]|nr:hypothetical protein [Gemmatimonadaceae bacterium]
MAAVATHLSAAPLVPVGAVVATAPDLAAHAAASRELPIPRAARRTMVLVLRRTRRLLRHVPDVGAMLSRIAADVPETLPREGPLTERLCHSWALAPQASRLTRDAVDAALGRSSLSARTVVGEMRSPDHAAGTAPASGQPRDVLARAFARGEALSRHADALPPARS